MKLTVLGHPTSLAICRARACCAFNRWGWVLYFSFFFLTPVSSSSSVLSPCHLISSSCHYHDVCHHVIINIFPSQHSFHLCIILSSVLSYQHPCYPVIIIIIRLLFYMHQYCHPVSFSSNHNPFSVINCPFICPVISTSLLSCHHNHRQTTLLYASVLSSYQLVI